MKIHLHQHQKKRHLHPTLLKHWVEHFMTQTAQIQPDRSWGELDVLLCDDEEIRSYNQQCFNRDQATDVISLTYLPVPGVMPFWTGELLVNVQRACECGPLHQGADHELLLYLAHGCDHLNGADDATDQERSAMRSRERKWIEQGRLAGLSLGVFEAEEHIVSG